MPGVRNLEEKQINLCMEGITKWLGNNTDGSQSPDFELRGMRALFVPAADGTVFTPQSIRCQVAMGVCHKKGGWAP